MGKRPNSDGKTGNKKKFKANGIIEPSTSGIYATCNKGREQNARRELLNLFQEKIEDMYDLENLEISDSESEPEELSIEDEIKKELEGLKEKKETKQELLHPIELGCECVVFIKTRKPIDPEKFIEKICEEAYNSKVKSTRYTQRLSPIQFSCSPTIEELKKLSSKVLGPHFHKEENQEPHTFAIQVNRRNFNQLEKGEIIRSIAESVGRSHGHKVDLKKYDKLILVECFKSNIGMSVVNNYDKYQKFNLQMIYEKSMEQENEQLSRVRDSRNVEETEEKKEAQEENKEEKSGETDEKKDE